MDKITLMRHGRYFLLDYLMRARFGARAHEGDEAPIEIFASEDVNARSKPDRIVKPFYYTDRGWALDTTYDHPDYILAYVWYVSTPKTTRLKAMTYAEAFDIGYQLGFVETKFFLEKGIWISSNPTGPLRELIHPYTVTPEKFRKKILG